MEQSETSLETIIKLMCSFGSTFYVQFMLVYFFLTVKWVYHFLVLIVASEVADCFNPRAVVSPEIMPTKWSYLSQGEHKGEGQKTKQRNFAFICRVKT